MNGSQFQPPSIPNSLPDYRGGINQPPLDQNNGISIYNSGAQGAPQQAPQQGGQQPQQGQQPQHGTQIPDYSTAPGYTQGPGRSNPDYQGPQQNSPQQQQQSPQQNDQGQQPTQQQPTQTEQPTQTPTNSQQPSQSPTQTSSPNREDKQEQERDCQYISGLSSAVDGKITYTAPAEIAQQVANAAKKWNDLGGIQIAPASSSSKSSDDQNDNNKRAGEESPDDADSQVTLNISVIDDPNVAWGGRHTSGDGDSPAEILINLARMNDAGPGGMESVLGHELGHDLGLADSVPGQLMAPSGSLPGGPQALDAQLLQQVSSQGATQQCAQQKMQQALQEFWCPFGNWPDGSCVGADTARSVKDFYSGEAKMLWDDLKGLKDTVETLYRAAGNTDDGVTRELLKQALAPLIGQGGPGSPSVGQAWIDLVHELGNGAIGWDDWFAGNYTKALQRVAVTAVEALATMGIGAVLKSLKVLEKAINLVSKLLEKARVLGLNAKDIAAIAQYTDTAFEGVNKALRLGQQLTPAQQEFASALSSALAKLPKYSGTVLRGFDADPAQIVARYAEKTIVTEGQFTSSDIVKSFSGNIQMTITSLTGKEVTKYSVYAASETEVLFNQGTKFFVDSLKQVGNSVQIVMHEVP